MPFPNTMIVVAPFPPGWCWLSPLPVPRPCAYLTWRSVGVVLGLLAASAAAGAPYAYTAQLAPTLTLNWNVVGSRVDFEAVLKLQRWWVPSRPTSGKPSTNPPFARRHARITTTTCVGCGARASAPVSMNASA